MSSIKRVYKPSSKQEKTAQWEVKKASYCWSSMVDYRKNPEQYRVGKGEQGVLICEPYKSEILAHWRFKNPEVAKKSAAAIFCLFETYLERNDFVGADMARKYLQMGYTRARRYANHKGGKKYDPATGAELPVNGMDSDKQESAQVFYKIWRQAEATILYSQLKKEWKEKYG